MSRVIDDRELTYDRMGDQFERALSDYDTQRRVEVLIDQFLTDDMIRGKSILDVGCGLGYFSKRLTERGAVVTACDIGPNLVQHTREFAGCAAVVADACNLIEHFGEEEFDVVVSSECIEHTPSPRMALRQMAGVLKHDGFLAVSTPNVLWSPVVKLATRLGLRPFDGYENFSSWPGIREVLKKSEIDIVRQKGLHLFPFQVPAHGISKWCDEHMQFMRNAMINICVLGRKHSKTEKTLTELEQSLAVVFGDGTI